jgi:uncharacterized protein
MATAYKTPGVYVEEIPKLPPSVAQVETAIPAFVGYTEKAMNISPDDLVDVPKRIGSLVEFELFYGKGAPTIVSEVNIDSSNNFVSATVSNSYFMYDSLRMFYANGGGDCYIVSVGKYPAAVSKSDLTEGIEALRKEDAPTIILFPDGVALTDNDIAEVQQAALLQCNDLGDRVGVFDVKKDDAKGTNFRNNIGINFLKYGMVYTPWLKVNLPKNLRFTDVEGVIMRSGISVEMEALTTDADVLALMGNVRSAYSDLTNVTAKTQSLEASGDLAKGFASLEAAFRADTSNGKLKDIFTYCFNITDRVNDLINAAVPNGLSLAAFRTNLTSAVGSTFDPILEDITGLEQEVDADVTGYTATDIATIVTAASWPLADAAGATTLIDEVTLTDDNDKRMAALNLLRPLFDQLNQAYINNVVNAAANHAKTLDNSMSLAFPVYKTILTGVGNSATVMPPSGAIAGVYALVDRTRGVWKAPANVSLSNVIGPATTFTATELDNLNVDTVAGKSVNAIRSFTGKGTLVFGARTLAGNDNEWRYVSVRRFFNMVEESCKKATEPFVFEPNDANTWVKVQGMIENFLTVLWRQGALQGAKPEHAFYVAVGLGKTMTALDILEGRMIVEIGMAVVRPAEFIILQFSHKMAES